MSDPIGRIKDKTRVIERALVGSISEAIFSIAKTKMPFLAFPLVKTIVKYLLDSVLFWLSQEGIILFNTAWISVSVSRDAAKLEAARQKAIKAVSGKSTDKYLDEVDDELRKAFDDMHRGHRRPL